MTQSSWPWTGKIALGDPGDAGPYAATKWTKTWRSIANNVYNPNAGIIAHSGTNPGEEILVQADSPASTSLNVLDGLALVDGSGYENSATETLTIAANTSGNDRIDMVVLRYLGGATQTVRIAVIQGTPAGTPVAPSLTQTSGSTYEIPLAEVYVANAFVTITAADITDRRRTSGAASTFGNPVLTTISTGAIARTNPFHTVAAETGTTDDLTSVTGAVLGDILVLRAAVGDIITIRYNTGADQFEFRGSTDFTLAGDDMVLMIHDGTNWIDMVINRINSLTVGPKRFSNLTVGADITFPDYDSGWFAVVVSTTYTKAHLFSTAPRRIEVYHSLVASPGVGDELVRVSTSGGSIGAAGNISANGTNIIASTGAGTEGTCASYRRQSAVGYYRFQAWL